VAVALFETYGKSSGALPHRLEADVFRHVAQKLQLLSQQQATVASATTSGTTSPTPPDVKAKDAEIQRLKEELAKANDELERIKRRLTAPTKP
jgi:small-conductance mechanosensitive channel